MKVDKYQIMIDYLNYIFPKRTFDKEYLDILYAIFVKGYGEGELAGMIESDEYYNKNKEEK